MSFIISGGRFWKGFPEEAIVLQSLKERQEFIGKIRVVTVL